MNEDRLTRIVSPIHGLSPRVRIFSAFTLSCCAAFCQSPWVIPGFLIYGLILLGMAKVPLDEMKKKGIPLTAFLAMVWIVIPLSFGGEAIFQFNIWGIPLSISHAGVILCVNISLKSMAILSVFMGLVLTLPIPALGQGLQQLKLPSKFVFLFLMSYRYIHVLGQEYQRLLRAARFRGFVPGTNVHSYKTYAYLCGMLFVRASLRAQRVHYAMQCRGFNGTFHSLDRFSGNGLNGYFLATSLVLGPGLLILDMSCP